MEQQKTPWAMIAVVIGVALTVVGGFAKVDLKGMVCGSSGTPSQSQAK